MSPDLDLMTARQRAYRELHALLDLWDPDGRIFGVHDTDARVCAFVDAMIEACTEAILEGRDLEAADLSAFLPVPAVSKPRPPKKCGD